jgi:hypothetical protein
MSRLLVTASVVPSSPILVTLMKEALSSSETSIHTRATWRNNPEDAILHSHRREKPQILPLYRLFYKLISLASHLSEDTKGITDISYLTPVVLRQPSPVTGSTRDTASASR